MQRERHNLPAHIPEDLAVLLGRLSDGLRELYGERYQGLVLYGSYARGDADEGSDVDLLLLLDGEMNRTEEITRSQDATWPLSLETGYVFSVIPVGADEYGRSKQPFLWNARDEGMLLS